MQTLDLETRLLKVEKLLGGRLLKANYDKLTEETGQKCKDLVVEYISLTDSVSHKNIIFIKQLSKVAINILKSDPSSLEALLEKLFRFNNEALQLIESGLDGYAQNHLLSLKAHLFTDGGDVSKALYEKTGDVNWAEEWYSAYKASADMSLNIEPRHAAYAYGFAGDAAKALFEKTQNIEWAKKWYEAAHLSAEMTSIIDPRHSAIVSGIAGNAATAVYKETRQKKWYSRAILSYRIFLNYYDLNPNPELKSLAEYAESTIEFLHRLPPLQKAIPKYL